MAIAETLSQHFKTALTMLAQCAEVDSWEISTVNVNH